MTWTERFAHGAVVAFFAGMLYVVHHDSQPLTTWSIEVAEAAIHRPAVGNLFSYQGEDEPVVAPAAVALAPVTAASGQSAHLSPNKVEAVPAPIPSQAAAEPSALSAGPPSGVAKSTQKGERLGIYSLVETTSEMRALRRYIARRYDTQEQQLVRWFKMVETEAKRYGIDPLLVVAIIAVESEFDPMAQSHQGALGLMQVIPKWHLDKIDARVAGEPEPEHLFDPKINIAVGIEVLAEGLARYRRLDRALQYYNGSLNDPQQRYSKKVLSRYRQFQKIAGVAEQNTPLARR